MYSIFTSLLTSFFCVRAALHLQMKGHFVAAWSRYYGKMSLALLRRNDAHATECYGEINLKNDSSKIPSESVSRMPMEFLKRQNNLICRRIPYIKFSKTDFPLVIF